MTIAIGSYSLTLAVIASAAAVFACVAAVRFDDARWLGRAKWLIAAVALLFTVSSAALVNALLESDFRLAYVAGYTERALPDGYKLAAFWAGQEGSLLLWAWMLGVISLLAVLPRRSADAVSQSAGFIGTLAVVCGFFAALLVFAANPFATLPLPVADGNGLNPLLQDPAMIAHPPFLFLGYSGYAVPFAFLMGALASRQSDRQWLDRARRWMVAAWLFLSIGILLGAQWAYIELGWGGYWAWDPVENASLLPWLTGTALLHSVMSQQQRGMMKRWTASLVAVTFILCIFGTYTTRSGVIQSVHAFGESVIGDLFLGFLIFLVTLSVAALAWRWKVLRADQPLERLLSKECAFLATNVLLSVITAATLVGTVLPLISQVTLGRQVSVGAEYYNAVVVPMGMLLLALMALGPLLGYRENLGRKAMWPAVVAVLAGLVTAVLVREAWSVAAAVISGFAVTAIVIELGRSVRARMASEGESPAAALVRVIDANHRRYGGHAVHLGMIMIMVGVTGSGLFGLHEDVSLTPGQSAQVGQYRITLHDLTQVREGHYTAVEARASVVDRAGRVVRLSPQMRFYDKSAQPHSQIAMDWSLKEDVYVTLAGWDQGGQKVAMQVMINPLVTWIWIGGIVLSLGGLFALLPRLAPRPVRAADASLLSGVNRTRAVQLGEAR